jgi:serine/threonine protein kinase
VDDDMLDHYVTQKSDKKANKGKTKFDPQRFMDIDHYLYGNIDKQSSKTFASVTKTLKSEIIFYNPITCKDLDLKKVRIENFRHLEVLSLSVYGDVVLGEYMPTGEIYFIRTINSSDTNEFCLTFDILMDINLSSMDFPFMAPLDILLKTQTVTYLITKFKGNFEGGYLISKVYDCGIFCEKVAIFFGVQIALIIDYFHKKNIKFLGFSPQNFLIGPDGYIKFVDYEMDYSTVKKNADKICLYDGPEEYNKIENDWYNFGVIMYEMLFGIPPSFINDVLVFQKYFTVSEEAKKFLDNIVKKEVYENYSLEELKKSDLFKDTNFDEILSKKINIGLRFLGDIDEIPMSALEGINTDNKVKRQPYNILNFNSIDLEC